MCYTAKKLASTSLPVYTSLFTSTLNLLSLLSFSFCWRWIMFQTFLLELPARLASRPKWRATSTGTGSCVFLQLGRRSLRYQKDKVSSDVKPKKKGGEMKNQLVQYNIYIDIAQSSRWRLLPIPGEGLKISIFQALTKQPFFRLFALDFFVCPKSLESSKQL